MLSIQLFAYMWRLSVAPQTTPEMIQLPLYMYWAIVARVMTNLRSLRRD